MNSEDCSSVYELQDKSTVRDVPAAFAGISVEAPGNTSMVSPQSSALSTSLSIPLSDTRATVV